MQINFIWLPANLSEAGILMSVTSLHIQRLSVFQSVARLFSEVTSCTASDYGSLYVCTFV